jgi:hypothetical protein
VRDGEQITRRRFMRDRVTLGQRHRQAMEGVTFSLYARPPFWRACKPRDPSPANNLLLDVIS